MKQSKKGLSLLLVLCMVLTMMPMFTITAEAKTSHPQINGHDMGFEDASGRVTTLSGVTLSDYVTGGEMYWDGGTKTLTLSGVTINSTGAGIFFKETGTLVLEGTNTIICSDSAIYNTGESDDLIITGSGILNIKADISTKGLNAIAAGRDCTIAGAVELNISASGIGVLCNCICAEDGTLTVGGSAQINTEAYATGSWARGISVLNCIIKDSSAVNLNSEVSAERAAGIYCLNDLMITGSAMVNAYGKTGGTDTESEVYGICNEGNFFTGGNSVVTASAFSTKDDIGAVGIDIHGDKYDPKEVRILGKSLVCQCLSAAGESIELRGQEFTEVGEVRIGDSLEAAMASSALESVTAEAISEKKVAVFTSVSTDTEVLRVAGKTVSLDNPYYHNGANGAIGNVDDNPTGANLSVAEDGTGGYIVTLNGLKDYPSEIGLAHHCGIEILVAETPYKFIINGANELGTPVAKAERGDVGAYSINIGIGPDWSGGYPVLNAGDLTFTGNGSLTIYDGGQGIASQNDILFDEGFGGTLTIFDCGKVVGECCINASGNVTIKNGVFNLSSYNSACVDANYFDIHGGKITADSINGTAIYAMHNIDIYGGSITANSGHEATMYAGEMFNLTAGAVEVTGILPLFLEGDVNLSGGTLKVHSMPGAELDGDYFLGEDYAIGICVANSGSEIILNGTEYTVDSKVSGAIPVDFAMDYSGSRHGVILRNEGVQNNVHNIAYMDGCEGFLYDSEAYPIEAVKYAGGTLSPEVDKFVVCNGFEVLKGDGTTPNMTTTTSLFIAGHIKFDSNGGSYITPVAFGVRLQDLSDVNKYPTKEGYSFCSWFKDAKLINTQNEEDYIEFPTTLYAGWAEIGAAPSINVHVQDATGNAISGVTVYLKRGNTPITSTVSDPSGSANFEFVLPGEYQIIAENGDDMATAICVITKQSENVTITVTENKNSSVVVESGTPDIVVGGVNLIAANTAENNTTTFTAVLLPEDPSDTTQAAIKEVAGAGSNVEFIEMTLTQTTGAGVVDIGDSNNQVLEILVPFDTTSRYAIGVLRQHGVASPAALTKVDSQISNPTAADEGKFYVGDNFIAIYASKFSTYAIKYSTTSVTPTTGGGGGGKAIITPAAITMAGIARPSETGVDRYLITDEHIVYINGNVQGYVQPQNNMTRAEAAQMFYNLLKNKNVTITTNFTDVKDGAWYAQAVNTLASMGIINGRGENIFAPNATITRAEFTAMAMRFAFETSGRKEFTDVKSTYWGYTAIGSAASYGWINGYSDGSFKPENNITRAEVVTIVNHILGRSADQAYVNANSGALKQFPDLQKKTDWFFYDMKEATNAHNYIFDEAYNETWR